jgi:hypothetical protein
MKKKERNQCLERKKERNDGKKKKEREINVSKEGKK